MSQVTALWVLGEVDNLLPNGYTDAQKRHWLQQAEAFCALEVGAKVPQTLRDDTILTAEMPYDGLYCRYVEAQIHYANGEMSRYNNAMAVWNELFLAWRDYQARGGAETRRVRALKLL